MQKIAVAIGWFLLEEALFYLIGMLGIHIFGLLPLDTTLEIFSVVSSCKSKLGLIRSFSELGGSMLLNVLLEEV